MTDWNRIQSLELQLAQKDAQIRRLVDELEQRVLSVVEQRDLARRVAIRLEQENHALAGQVCALCAGHLVPVHVVGEAT